MRGTKEEYVPDFLKESQSGISIERSPPPPMNPNLGSLTFMQIDADYYTSGCKYIFYSEYLRYI